MTRIAIVCRQSPDATDAIRDHAVLLGEALRARGVDVDLHLRTPRGHWLLDPAGTVRPRLVDGLAGYDAVLVQYNPFLWGHWGFAPWLPVELLRLRRRQPQLRIALILHEPFVPMINWRWTLMGLWQRVQLAAVRFGVDTVFVTIEVWTERFRSWWPRRPTKQLPAGSNFPDRSADRDAERSRLGATDNDLVVAIVDTGGAGRVPMLVSAALARLDTPERRTLLLVRGAGASLPPNLPTTIETHLTGRLDPTTFAARLSAADIFLAPYIDGVSTRRGSLMAALQHGIAVVGTDGFLTDGVLREAADALLLAPIERPELFAAAAERLAANPGERAALGAAGRVLYRERFDWPVLAASLLDELAP